MCQTGEIELLEIHRTTSAKWLVGKGGLPPAMIRRQPPGDLLWLLWYERGQAALPNLRINQHIILLPPDPGPVACRIREPVSMAEASSKAGACHRVNTYRPAASGPAILYKRRATSSYQRRHRRHRHQARPFSHALPDASSAFPRSDLDGRGMSCSGALPRLSTRFAEYPGPSTGRAQYPFPVSNSTLFLRGPTSQWPSTGAALPQSTSNAPCDGCTRRYQDEFPPSPRRARRSIQSQFPPARDLRYARRALPHGWDESKADLCGQSRRAISRWRCGCESAPASGTLKSGSSDPPRGCRDGRGS